MTSVKRLQVGRVATVTPRWCYLAAGFFICNSTGFFTIIVRMRYGEWEAGGNPLTQTLNMIQIFLSVFLFWAGYRRVGSISTGGKLLLALTAFLLATCLWSVDSQTSSRRAILYFFFMLGTIGISNLLNGDEYLDLIRRLVLSAVIITLVFFVISPVDVLMSDGTTRGLFAHKNVFGQILAAGVLASLHGFRAYPARRWSSLATIGLFIGIGFTVHSATALMTMFAFCGAEVLVALYRLGGPARVVMLTAATPVLLVFFLAPDLLLDALGKDSTLTGRTELWAYVDLSISQQPLFGWGFDAFWSKANPVANQISRELGWSVPQAHHGLRELLLEVGAVGASFFLFIFIRNIVIAVQCLRTSSRGLGRSLLLCCGGIVLVGLTELVLVDFSQISTGMLFTMGLIGERALSAEAVPRRSRSRSTALRPAGLARSHAA